MDAVGLTACGHCALHPVLTVSGTFRHSPAVSSQGLRGILGFREENWTGSGMWLCDGEHHMPVEALHEVMH